MRIAQDFPVWDARWVALDAYLEAIATVGGPRGETLNQLRASLRKFGSRQFDFFMDGFDPGRHLHHLLDLSDDFPIDYVLDTTLAQISYDTAVIERAVEGRREADSDGAFALALGDDLTHLALRPAVDSGLLEETVSVTYFQKSADIRVIPYAQVALIGVPRTLLNVRDRETVYPDAPDVVYRDYLAIPHEVGHYVYNNGRYAERRILDYLRKLVENRPIWLKRWLEEIFCDVYGALVAGPVIALDFQDLLLRADQERFLEDDGDHPIEAIRPYIYTEALRLLKFPGSIITGLEQRWEKWREMRQVPESFVPFGMDTAVTYATARQAVEQLTREILCTVLAGARKLREVHPAAYWTGDPADTVFERMADAVQEPMLPDYAEFDAFVETLLGSYAQAQEAGTGTGHRLPELQCTDGVTLVVVTPDGAAENERGIGLTNTWLDSLTEPTRRSIPVSAPVWAEVLAANGWATQGPNQTWPPS